MHTTLYANFATTWWYGIPLPLVVWTLSGSYSARSHFQICMGTTVSCFHSLGTEPDPSDEFTTLSTWARLPAKSSVVNHLYLTRLRVATALDRLCHTVTDPQDPLPTRQPRS